MFKVIEKDGTIRTFDSFDEAKKKGIICPVIDEKGYKYFYDGTGDGYRSLKESNKDCFYSNHGIYNQTKLSIGSVISNAKWILYCHGIKESLDYIKRVKSKKETGSIEITK